MAGHRVYIPRWHPTPLNKLLDVHWGKRQRAKDADLGIVAGYCTKVPQAACKRRLTLVIRLAKGKRGCDPDAYQKSLLDALKRCRKIKDDSHQWVELAPVQYERGTETDWGTWIVLEDIG